MGYRIIDNANTIKVVKDATTITLINKSGASVSCVNSTITIQGNQSVSFKFSDVESPRFPSVEELVDTIYSYINASYAFNGQYVENVWVETVDLLSTGQSVTIPVNNGNSEAFNFIPTRVYVELVDLAGSITGDAIVTVGNNGSSYNNVCGSATLSSLNAERDVQSLTLATLASIDISSNAIVVNVSTAATGATTMNANFYIFGIVTQQ